MTYNVFGGSGTLSLTQSVNHLLTQLFSAIFIITKIYNAPLTSRRIQRQ